MAQPPSFTQWQLVVKGAGISAVVVLGLLLWRTPPVEGALHNLLHDLSVVPLLLGGVLFGWTGAASVLLLAAVTQAPHFAHALVVTPAHATNEVMDLAIFGVAGVVTGLLSARERAQRAGLEQTKRELEEVYRTLQHNVERLRKAERLSAAGQLAAGLAHEIRNPLASISGAAGILQRRNASAANQQDCLEIIAQESQRLNKLLTSFLEFARARTPRFQRTDAAEIIASAVMLVQHATDTSRIRFRQEAADPLPQLECDPEQLKQVLLNLLLNAVQATPDEGLIRISAAVQHHTLEITVCDEGCGVPPEQQEQIFDPFFTTKKTGTGLGLAIASQIVEQHGGILALEHHSGTGATFRLELPLIQEYSA